MLSADEYERIYLSQGRAAADQAFNREMRKENLKTFRVLIAIFTLIVAGLFILLLGIPQN